MKRRIAVLVIATALVGGAGVTAAAADPPVPQVGPHQHWVNLPDGTQVSVGPESCTNGQSIQFDNFHNNVHRGAPGDNGVVTSSGCPS